MKNEKTNNWIELNGDLIDLSKISAIRSDTVYYSNGVKHCLDIYGQIVEHHITFIFDNAELRDKAMAELKEILQINKVIN